MKKKKRTSSSSPIDENAANETMEPDRSIDDGRKASVVECRDGIVEEEKIDVRDCPPSGDAAVFDIAPRSVDFTTTPSSSSDSPMREGNTRAASNSSPALLRSEDMTMGYIITGGDERVVDDDDDDELARNNSREGGGTSRDGLRGIPDGNAKKDDAIGNDPSPPSSAMQSVRFAPTSRMRRFDSDREVASLLRGDESCTELQFRDGKQKRIRPKRQQRRVPHEGLISATTTDDGRAKIETVRTIREGGSANTMLADVSLVAQTGRGRRIDRQYIKRKAIQVVLVHSHSHTRILHEAMQYIHGDRDVLLEALLKWCGILNGASNGGALASFLTVLPPMIGTRTLLEEFHRGEFLDLLEFPKQDDTFQSSASLREGTDIVQPSGVPINEDGTAFHVDDGACAESLRSRSLPPHFAESCVQYPSDDILSKYGLEDDCPYPATPQARALLWKYCLATAGASWHAASLLTANDRADVAIHWGGGRHHAHASKAGGFCYVSDVILAIQRLLHGHDDQIDARMLRFSGEGTSRGATVAPIQQRNLSSRRILYIDIDIHHADAVQAAFYATDRVLTVSFHRHSPGFFPATSGSISEKGEVGTSGFGYNLNVPLPAGIDDVQFIHIYRKALFGLGRVYDPHAVVLCVGADGLEGDALISGSLGNGSVTGEGWTLSPEGLAECVRIAAAFCAGFNEVDICVSPIDKKKEGKNLSSSERVDGPDNEHFHNVKPDKQNSGNILKLLILGGGGYTPAQTARTQLLCTAAACEGARPGMFWSELPRDIPCHEYFPRYGPLFELVSEQKKKEIFASYLIEVQNEDMSNCDRQILREAGRSIALSVMYIDHQRRNQTPEKLTFCYDQVMEKDYEMELMDCSRHKKNSSISGGGRRRKKKKIETLSRIHDGS